MAVKKSRRKGAKLTQEYAGFTPGERKRFDAARKKYAARILPQIKAIRKSRLISHEDLAICINSKD